MTTTITHRCISCKGTSSQPIEASTSALECIHCHAAQPTHENAIEQESVNSCIACGCDELFLRKDFPQRLGVTIVAIGLGLSCVTWLFHNLIGTFAILFITALIDVALFKIMGDVIECYRCHAQYRGTQNTDSVGAFDLEVHERHRQTEARKAQLRQPAS